MWMGAGMESIRVVRSSCGDAAYRVVGALWLSGCTALIGGLVSWFSAGRALIVRGA